MPTSPKPKSAIFIVRVNPRSSQNKLEVVDSSSLKVWVTAPPVDGEANTAICELIAKLLAVPKSAVSILLGESGRVKRVEVVGISTSEALSLLKPSKTA